ncbi:MAG: hypothetical protein ACXQTX_02400 [Candidatus Syntropharchaeia archaeon]
MRLGDPLLKTEVQKLEIKRTDEFVKDEGKLARVFRDKNGYPYLLKGERMVPLILEEGDCIYNSNGTVRERVGEPTPIKTKIIDMTEEKKEEKEKVEEKEKTERWAGTQEIVPAQQDFLAPVTTIEKAVQTFGLYEEAKKRILTDNDVIWIGKDGRPTEKGQGHPHIKRSGWRKLARFFGLSCQILERRKEWAEDSEGRYYIWTYKVRASHPCGAYQDAEGVCTSRDPFFSKKHGRRIEPEEENIMMKAQTVAFNRAISDLLGSGEVSAEEVGE